MASGHVGCVSNAAKAGLLLLTVSALRAQTGNVQFTDPEFFPGRWTPVILTEGQGGTAELRWELFDGNPQSSGNVRTVVNGSPSVAAISRVYAFFFRAEASFSPRERGAAIASLAYSEDLRYLGTGSSGVESTAPALRQNGRLYAAGGLPSSIPSTWTTLRISGLAASSFVEYSVANGQIRVDTASHPDFSGGAIQFGFLRARSNPSSTPETHELGIDNWSFTLTTSASPVIAAPDSYQTIEDTALVVPAPGVLGNDVNNGGAFLATVVAAPRNGDLRLSADGGFTYAPRTGFTGFDTFEYQPGGVSSAVVTINVLRRLSCQLTTPVSPSGDVSALVTLYNFFTNLPLGSIPVLLEMTMNGNIVHSQTRPTDESGRVSYTLPRQLGHLKATFQILGQPGSCEGDVFVPSQNPCLFGQIQSLISGATASPMANLRRFRDEHLAREPSGRERIRQYYRYSPEVIRLLSSDLGLLPRALDIYRKYQPVLRGVVAGKRPSVTAEQIAEIAGFLDRLEPRATPGLRAALADIRRDLRDRDLLARYGIAAPAPRGLLADLPLRFEENRGQADGRFSHVVKGAGYEIALAPDRWHLRAGPRRIAARLSGSNRQAQARGEQRLSSRSHYLLGRDPTRWLRDISGYGRVRYASVYPGVDLAYYGREGRLEFDFIVAPGADPGRIALSFDGLKPSIGPNGDLAVDGPGGQLRLDRPVAYQEAAGERRFVAARFRLNRDHSVGIALAAYDRSRELVIDPVLTYLSYLGGQGTDVITAIALGPDGSIYLTGSTTSQDYPTGSPLQAALAAGTGGDVFLTKLNPSGRGIVYSTYLGGSDDDAALGIALDPQGNVCLTGATKSRDFPLRQAIQSAFGGPGPLFGTDAFVAKVSPSGASLVYSTYLGGGDNDAARGIAVGPDGSVTITGATASADFPTALPMQAALRGGGTFRSDAFAARLNPAGTALTFSTFLGGSGDDLAAAVALDSGGNIYLTGLTYSDDFPLVRPLAGARAGGADVFVARLRPDGRVLTESTYLGGDGDDMAFALAPGGGNTVHITGVTGSPATFPRANAAQLNPGSSAGGGHDAFVAKLDLDRPTLLYSTLLGGGGFDAGFAVTVDGGGNALVTGVTRSPDFASGDAPYPRISGGSDSFAARLDPNGRRFLFRTYLGGSGGEAGLAIAFGAGPAIYFGGSTTSVNLPVFSAFQSSAPAQLNGFLARITTDANPCEYTLSPSAQSLGAAAGSRTFTVDTRPNCAWYARPLQSWITIAPGATGTGPGAVTYSFAANTSTAPRSGGIEVADSAFLPLTQSPPACSFAVDPPSASLPATAATASFSVATAPDCPWTATGGATWMQPAGLSSGSGPAQVTFSAAANPTASARTAKLTIAGLDIHISQSAAVRTQVFDDVPLTHPYFEHTALLKQHGVTQGCTASRYCPDDATTRGQMAVFIIRALQGGGNFTYPTAPYFQDVPRQHPYFGFIQKMRELGITEGCSAASYCPDAPVTRGQMAVFLVRAKLRLPAGFPFYHRPTPYFTDIGNSHPYFPFIQKLREMGITTGCTPGAYCPEAPNTRGQMAVFLIRAFFTP